MYNRIILIGRPTRDPELRFTAEGHAVASFTLAVEGRLEIRSYTDAQGIRRKGARVVANGVRFLTPKSAAGAGSGQQGIAGNEAEGGETAAETPSDSDIDVDF